MTTTTELVGAAEIEKLHGIPRYKMARLIKRGLWIEPVARLEVGNVYDAAQVATKVAQLRQAGHL